MPRSREAKMIKFPSSGQEKASNARGMPGVGGKGVLEALI